MPILLMSRNPPVDGDAIEPTGLWVAPTYPREWNDGVRQVACGSASRMSVSRDGMGGGR